MRNASVTNEQFREKEPVNNIGLSKLTNKLETVKTSFDCTSNHIWRYLHIVNLFRAYTSGSHGMPLSNSVKVNNKTIQIRCKGF